MQKAFSIFLFALLFCSFTKAQDVEVNVNYTTNPGIKGNNHIYYTAGEKLAISDFEGAPDNGSNAVAITSSGFAFKAAMKSNEEGNKLTVTVYCNFNKSKSWMKAKGKNKYILGHEQLHFDISFIGAMRFMEKLNEVNFTVKNYNNQLENAYYAAITEMQNIQQQYDSQTMNGQLPDEQSAWIKKINKEIESYAAKY